MLLFLIFVLPEQKRNKDEVSGLEMELELLHLNLYELVLFDKNIKWRKLQHSAALFKSSQKKRQRVLKYL